MSKTIKVIELLNKIANGEEAPKQIEYKANLYRLDEDKNYRDVVDGSYFVEDLSFNLANLSDEVQIIEEQEEIDIQNIEELDENFTYIENHSSGLGIEKVLNKAEIELVNKINELVQAVKQLDKKIKKKKQYKK